jgi:hypothetical protein
LASKFNANTQAIILKDTKETSQSNDTFNLKIEAPVIIVPEGTRLWIADLGTFDITKAGLEQNQAKQIVLEGKKAKVYFVDINMEIPNLNQIVTQPDLIHDFLPKMNLVVSDLEFSIDLFNTEILGESLEKKPKSVKNLNFDIHPFRINLFDTALQSLLSLALSIGEDMKREKAFIEKILKKGDVVKGPSDIEFNIGYEVWETCDLVLEGKNMYTISTEHNLLASQDISKVSKIGLDQGADSYYYLSLSFKHKKTSFRCKDKGCLADLRFKIQSIISVLEQTSEISQEGGDLVSQFDSDLIVSLQFTEVVLTIGNYYKDATSFEFAVTGVAFSSQTIGGKEEGIFQFIDCVVSDYAEKSKILTFESGLYEAKPGLVYKYNYTEGQIDSVVQICTVSLAYKVDYVMSLMKLTELILEYVLEGKKNKTELSLNRKQSADTFILDDPVVRKSSTKQSLLINCSSAHVDLYFKKEIKSVSLSAKRLKFEISSQGLNSVLSSEIYEAKIVDYNAYPYKIDQTPLEKPIDLVSLKESGKVMFTFVTTELDSLTGKVSTKSDYVISGVVLNWIQQPMLRFIDFLIFQVIEIFYPTLVSFSKYYTKEDIIRGALLHLNNSSYLKQSYTIMDSMVNLPSTVDPKKSIRLRVPTLSVKNDRLNLQKIANKDRVQHLYLDELESDIWDIAVQQVRLAVVSDKPSAERTLTLEPFDFSVRVHYLTKLFELGFLYDLEDDLRYFDKQSLQTLDISEQKGFSPSRKQEKTLAELRNFAKQSFDKKNKEKLYIDGRYHVEISIKKAKAYLTNQLVNMLVEIIGNNTNFDDGMDSVLRNRYETTDKVIQYKSGIASLFEIMD